VKRVFPWYRTVSGRGIPFAQVELRLAMGNL
jgi:hypothetical protein